MAFGVVPRCCTDAPRTHPSMVKLCGVARADDAAMLCRAARRLPADVDVLIGMIVWPGSRRSVPPAEAAAIARIARDAGIRPVAVFVDEGPQQIADACRAAGVDVAQLHGRAARQAARADPAPLAHLGLIDVREVAADAAAEPPVDRALLTVCDAPGGGSGTAFDWRSFEAPETPWLLAGGLTPDNVADAVRLLRPTGVDVSSGICAADRVRKCPLRVERFLSNAFDL